MTNNLFEEKWGVFEKRVKLFRYIPFARFVLLAGSMATGKVHDKSDFDVIIGVRRGRVFTTWFLSATLFELFRWREKPGRDTSDKFGMSHFVAPEGYLLSPPYNAYWEGLYKKLIPAMGDEDEMKIFFDVNDWVNPARKYVRHEKYIGEANSLCKRISEFILGGRLGDFFERVLKAKLIKKIENPNKIGYKPKVFWDDTKLELYRDTKRIDEILGID